MMDDMHQQLSRLELFRGFSACELSKIDRCLLSRICRFGKKETVLKKQDSPLQVGVVLTGRVYLEHYDELGNRSIQEVLRAQEIFGLEGICGQRRGLSGTYVAAVESTVVLLDFSSFSGGCEKNCPLREELLRRILFSYSAAIARQQLKAECVSQRSTQQKVMSFLLHCASEAGTTAFDLDLTRQELADFLCVNRSALIETLQGMKSKGVLSFEGKHFELYDSVGRNIQ